MPKNKFEDCVRKVKAKQPPGCVNGRKWGKKIRGRTCYNPWAVCHASIGGKGKVTKRGARRVKAKRKVYTGIRGGRYIKRKGKKVYLKK